MFKTITIKNVYTYNVSRLQLAIWTKNMELHKLYSKDMNIFFAKSSCYLSRSDSNKCQC